MFIALLTYSQNPRILGTYAMRNTASDVLLYDHIIIERVKGKIECCRKFKFTKGPEVEERYTVIEFSEKKALITISYEGNVATYRFKRVGDKYEFDASFGILVYAQQR